MVRPFAYCPRSHCHGHAARALPRRSTCNDVLAAILGTACRARRARGAALSNCLPQCSRVPTLPYRLPAYPFIRSSKGTRGLGPRTAAVIELHGCTKLTAEAVPCHEGPPVAAPRRKMKTVAQQATRLHTTNS